MFHASLAVVALETRGEMLDLRVLWKVQNNREMIHICEFENIGKVYNNERRRRFNVIWGSIGSHGSVEGKNPNHKYLLATDTVSYPHMSELFDGLDIDVEAFDMSLSVSLDEKQRCEWGSRNGFRSLFAQTNNAVNPNFWKMLEEIKKFKIDVIMYLEGLEKNPENDCLETIGQFFESRNYSELFQKAYMVRFPFFSSHALM
ncbi:Interferon-induced double-stranded RNA-activated protein kinase [Bienertia sinuspersici]